MTPTPPLDAAGLPPGYPFRDQHELTPRQVKAAMDAQGGAQGPRLLLIDCRREDEWKLARIDGAVLIPLAEMERRVDEIKDLAQDAGAAQIAVHCHHGMRSLKATLMLQAHGLNARSVAGGIDLWSLDIDPRVPRY